MRKILLKSFLMVLLLSLTFGLHAQYKVTSSDFDTGIPSTWSQDPISAAVPWSSGSTGVGTIVPFIGSQYAKLYTNNPQVPVKLITPIVKISGVLEEPVVSFRVAQPSTGFGSFDTLRVYARNSVNGPWVQLHQEDAAVPAWTLREVSLENLTGDSVQVAFEYIYAAGLGVALDDVYIGEPKSCVLPSALRTFRVTHNSALLMWSGSEYTQRYDIKVSTTPITDFTATANVYDGNVVYDNQLQLSTLLPLTNYYFYVKADCGSGDVTDWSSAGTFTTLCSPLSLPYSENFDSYLAGQFPNCWYKTMQSLGDWGSSSASSNNEPSISTTTLRGLASLSLVAYHNNSAAYSTPRITRSWVAITSLSIADITAAQITFWANTPSDDCKLYVGIMNDPTDISNFEEIALITFNDVNTWEEFIIPFTNANDATKKQVVFMMDGGDYDQTATVYIDDIHIEVIPSCPKPSMVRVSKIGSDSLVMNWTSSNATSWDVKVSTVAMTDMTQNGNVQNITVTSNPAVISGLTPLTSYYIYIRSNCGVGDVSEWSNAILAKTSCVAISSFPYVESFEDEGDGTFPACWFRPKSYEYNSVVSPNVSYVNISGSDKSLQLRSSAYGSIYAVSPALNCELNELMVSFVMKYSTTYYQGTIEVGIMSNPYDLSTYVPVKSFTPVNTDVADYSVMLDNVTLGGIGNYVAFRFSSESSGAYAYIDDIEIDSIPSCVTPSNVRMKTIMPTSAVVGWNAQGNENSWNVKISSKYMSRPSTAVGDVFEGSVTTDSILISNLKMGLTYYGAVQAICSDGSSLWERFTFTTICGDISELPYIEDFSDYGFGTSVFVPCWWSFVSSHPYISSAYNNTAGKSNSGSLYFVPTSSRPLLIAATPEINVPGYQISDMLVSFSMRAEGAEEAFIIGVMSNTDTASFVAVDTVYSSGLGFDYFEVYLNEYTGSGKRVAFKVTQSSYSKFMDDLRIEVAPDCKRIVSINLETLTNDEISVSWTPREDATSWQVVIVPKGGDPNLATPVTVTTPSYTFTGLTARTEYQIYIRGNCGVVGGVQVWSTALNITTTPIPEQLPLSTTFEDADDNDKWVLLNGDQVNRFVIGTGANNTASGNKALYITDGSGVNAVNNYNSSATSYVIAYRTLRFEPGIYDINFDWRCVAESGYDLGRLCLVDPSVALEAGNSYGMTNTNNNLPSTWVYDLADGNLQSNSMWLTRNKKIAISSTKVYNLVVFWKNDGTAGSQPPLGIDNLSIVKLDCAPVVDIQVSVTDSSANLTWPNLINATQWDVKISEQPIRSDLLDTITSIYMSSVITNNSIQLNNLAPAQTFYFYVRPYCNNGEVEEWTNLLFTTECEAITSLPFVEDFESYGNGSGVVPTCWKVGMSYEAVWYDMIYPAITTEYNSTLFGERSLAMASESVDANTYSLISSPRILVDSAKNLTVEFNAYGYSGYGLGVGVMTNPLDPSTFDQVAFITIPSSYTWHKMTVPLSSYTGDGNYIAIRVNGSYNNVYIDDFTITKEESCAYAFDLYASRLNATGAKINWSSTSGTSYYNVKVSTTEIDPLVDEGDIYDEFVSGQTNVNLDGLLTPDSEYYFYVQVDCDIDGLSYWSTGCKFKTTCVDLDVPYSESFAGYGFGRGTMANCWYANLESYGLVSGNYEPFITRSEYYDSDSVSLQMKCYYSASGSGESYSLNSVSTVVTLPAFDENLSDLYLEFYAKGSADTKLKVGVVQEINGMSDFELVDTFRLGDWSLYTVLFTDIQGPGYITLFYDGVENASNGTMYIDQLKVETLGGCKSPASLSSMNITENSAELFWVPMSEEDSVWHVQVSLFDAGADSYLMDGRTDFILDTVINGTSLVVNDLLKRTTYYYYVRPVCEDGDGPRFPTSRSFRTDCGTVVLPYLEDFENYSLANNMIPECWTRISNYDPLNPKIVSTGYYGGEGKQMLYLYSTNSTYSVAVLPDFDVDSIKRLTLIFDVLSSSSTSNLKVGVMSDPSDISTFELVHTYNVSSYSTWDNQSFSFDGYEGEGRYIALMSNRISENSSNNIYVNNVIVMDDMSCLRPSNLSVSQTTTDGALLSWKSESLETLWDVCVVPTQTPISELNLYSSSKTMFQINGLLPATTYDFYVRANCGNQTSLWRGPISFETRQIATNTPYNTSFESDNANWLFVNGTEANKFAIGNAISNTGSQALYVSNDGGLTHSYDIESTSVVYAYRTVHFEPGQYQISYYWQGQGESYSDYGRVFLAPSSAVFKAGTSNFSYYDAPTSWIALDNASELNMNNNWTVLTYPVTIDKAMDYKILFAWRNNSYGGSQPPFAVDDVTISYVPCFKPMVSYDSITSTSADILIHIDGNSSLLKLSSTPIAEASLDTTVADGYDGILNVKRYRWSSLVPDTEYYVYVRGICPTGDTTLWSSSSFRTACNSFVLSDTQSYEESFDTYGVGRGAMLSCWQLYTNASEVYPYITSENFSAPGALVLATSYSYSTGTYQCYAISPRLTGKPLNEMQMTFKGKSKSDKSALIIGIVSDPYDMSTFVRIDSIKPSSLNSWQDFTIYFDNYIGEGEYIAFKTANYTSSNTQEFIIDNLIVEPLSDCRPSKNINIDKIRDKSFDIKWEETSDGSSWELRVYSALVTFSSELPGDILDTIITGSSYVVNNIAPASSYTVLLRKICAAGDTSSWSSPILVATLCGVIELPYAQDFSTFLPKCWSRGIGHLETVARSGVLNTTTLGWNSASAEVGFNTPHAKLNIYGTNRFYWLVTPPINVNQAALLSVDLALTDYNSPNSIDDVNNQGDDRFVIVVSVDNGATWDTTRMVVWKDSVGADYQYSTIPVSGATYSINLSHYIGNEIIIGFYGESRINNGDNDLHMDNLLITPIAPTQLADTTCQGHTYLNYGFDIQGTSLLQSGDFTFSRIVQAEGGYDSVIVLLLHVLPYSIYEFDATICQGEVYSNYGFNDLSTTGLYRRMLTASNGCDSLAILNLTVQPTTAKRTELTLCESETPYQWQGRSLTTTGVYSDSLTSSLGCDSVLVLDLTVNPEYAIADSRSIKTSDMPYTYMDTVFNDSTMSGRSTHIFTRKTDEGCDSVITLTLDVENDVVGMYDVVGDYFELYPNPIQRYGEVTVNANFTEAELEGMLLEVFNSVGECVVTQRPSQLPILVSGFDASGVYIVRITTTENRVVYGKVVVK